MAKQNGRSPAGPQPPTPAAGAHGGIRSGSSFGGYKKQDASNFAEHAQEVKRLAGGGDIVEGSSSAHNAEKRPAPFNRKELQVVRSWAKSRPLEPNSPAAAMVDYPRMWTTKRGRYAKFNIPGTGTYGLVRARPTY